MKKILRLFIIVVLVFPFIKFNAHADVQIPDINSGWYWPVHTSQNNLYSPYGGWRTLSDGKDLHQGIDLCGGNNLSIYASRAGDVAFKGYNDWFGYYICLYHGEWNGHKIYSSYMHFAEPAYFSVGETVQAGQVIGKMGTTGSSTGVHLHFQIFKTKGYATSANLPHDNETQLNANYINTNPSKATMEAWGLVNNHPERFNNSSHPSCKYGAIAYMKVGTPATPTITSVSTVSTSSLKVKWNAVSGATSYRIDRRISGGDAYSTIVSSTTSTSFTDTGLQAGSKYYYRVYALNGSATSGRSETAGAYTQCEKPTINNISSTSTDSITIGWTYVKGASSYRIDRRDNDSYTTIATGITTNSFTDTGLEPGTKHFYRVYAVNDNSVSAKPDGYRAFVQCEMPVISKLTANNTGSITIIWNGVNGATAYRIDRRKKGADAYQTIVESTTDTNYTDTGLVAGSMYYYRIYALNDNSISAKPDGVGVYTKFVYNIKYDANSGGGAPADQEKEEDATIKISTVIPVRTGYTFKNWNTKADGSGIDYNAGGSYTANTTTTLYAQWRANIYNVAYNANGGVGEDVTSTHTYNTEATLNENTFTRDGYSFAGWSTDKSATSETYVDKQSVKNLTEVDGETVTLYAIWIEDEIEAPTPIKYSFGQSVQIGLIEPWFIKANLLVYTDSISKPIDYSTLVDYGAYFIRKSELSDSSLTQNTISNEDILSNPNTVKKSKLEGTATIDGSLLAANYDKGLYTYEMSDSLFVLFYVEDENGIQYAPIRERNIKNLLDERKNNAESFTNVLERNVYDKMSTLEANIKKYRAQFSEISKLPEMGALKLSEHIVNNGAFTEETVETYTFGNSVQLVLVEPWGLKVNAIVQKNGSLIDYNSVEEYGAIVFYDIDGEIACGRMTQEELRTKNDAYVFSSKTGDATTDGSLITAIYNKGIYTYQLNSNAYVMFYVKDAYGYHYGDVKVRNAYELAKTRGADTSGNYGEQEKVVYQDMVTMYETVTEYRDDYFSKN